MASCPDAVVSHHHHCFCRPVRCGREEIQHDYHHNYYYINNGHRDYYSNNDISGTNDDNHGSVR